MRIGLVIVMVLLLNACKDEKSKAKAQLAADRAGSLPSYTLEIHGIVDNITVGTAIEARAQIKEDGQRLRDAQLKIALTIVCGARKHTTQRAVNSRGIATFTAFTPDNSWVGDCTATATAKVDKQDLTQSASFTLVSQPPLIAGLEYAVNNLKDKNGDVYNGFLSLNDCADGQVLAITDDSNDPIFAGSSDGVAINRGKNWRYVIVGVPPSGCKLMLASSAGGTRRELRAVRIPPVDSSIPPVSDNIAQGKVTALQQKNKKLAVVTERVSGGSLYVYDHADSTWQGVSQVKWGGSTTTAVNWSAGNNRALLRVAQGNTNWWYLATER